MDRKKSQVNPGSSFPAWCIIILRSKGQPRPHTPWWPWLVLCDTQVRLCKTSSVGRIQNTVTIRLRRGGSQQVTPQGRVKTGLESTCGMWAHALVQLLRPQACQTLSGPDPQPVLGCHPGLCPLPHLPHLIRYLINLQSNLKRSWIHPSSN